MIGTCPRPPGMPDAAPPYLAMCNFCSLNWDGARPPVQEKRTVDQSINVHFSKGVEVPEECLKMSSHWLVLMLLRKLQSRGLGIGKALFARIQWQAGHLHWIIPLKEIEQWEGAHIAAVHVDLGSGLELHESRGSGLAASCQGLALPLIVSAMPHWGRTLQCNPELADCRVSEIPLSARVRLLFWDLSPVSAVG